MPADFDATRSILGETDIVYELRDLCNRNVLDTGIQREAANEIEWLRAENTRLRGLRDAYAHKQLRAANEINGRALAALQSEKTAAQAERDALLEALTSLVHQVEKFAEEHGEASFYTGKAKKAIDAAKDGKR